MVEIAKDYHDKLQDLDTNTNMDMRENTICLSLEAINTSLTVDKKLQLDLSIGDADIQTALASAANRKAPGLDGIPYELWKILNKRNSDLKKEGREGFDIIKAMRLIFNSIEMYRNNDNSNFSEGWMCPIFKKGEMAEIANYHPITVLNTDYKLFAKSIQAKLAKVAHNIIHPNQAGFMKKQSIINHIHTIDLMKNLAELDETNHGMILALDQEML